MAYINDPSVEVMHVSSPLKNKFLIFPEKERVLSWINMDGLDVGAIVKNTENHTISIHTNHFLIGDCDFKSEDELERKRETQIFIRKLEHPDINDIGTFVLYRTNKGLRFIARSISNSVYVISDKVFSFLERMDCDPNYISISKLRKSFAARISPKRNRVEPEKKISYRICNLIGEFDGGISPQTMRFGTSDFLQLHDLWTGASPSIRRIKDLA